MEKQIYDLQTLKMRQLIKFGKYPASSIDDINNKMEALSRTETTNFVDSLRVLDCPRKRLLCKLAFDVTELSADLETFTTECLKQRICARYLLRGDKFLLNNVPSHPALKAWYMELSEKCLPSEIEISVRNQALYPCDKLAYNLKYEPFCTKCKGGIGLLSKQGNQMYSFPQKEFATLSFSTCHKGYCLRINILTGCKLCSNQSEINTKTEGLLEQEMADLRIITDPSIENLAAITVPYLKKPSASIRELIKEVWSLIDKVASYDNSDQ